jgi:hypothetical protein
MLKRHRQNPSETTWTVSVSDVGYYVVIIKLIYSAFNLLPVFTRRWKIQTYLQRGFSSATEHDVARLTDKTLRVHRMGKFPLILDEMSFYIGTYFVIILELRRVEGIMATL